MGKGLVDVDEFLAKSTHPDIPDFLRWSRLRAICALFLGRSPVLCHVKTGQSVQTSAFLLAEKSPVGLRRHAGQREDILGQVGFINGIQRRHDVGPVDPGLRDQGSMDVPKADGTGEKLGGKPTTR